MKTKLHTKILAKTGPKEEPIATPLIAHRIWNGKLQQNLKDWAWQCWWIWKGVQFVNINLYCLIKWNVCRQWTNVKEHIISAWLKVKMAALTNLPCSACFFTNCFVNMFVLTFQEMKCRSSHETLGFAFVEQWMVTQTNFLLLFARFARTSQTSLVMRKWCLNPSGKYLSRVSSTYSWMWTKQESKWWLTTTQKKQWKEGLWGLKENCWKLWDKQCCLSVNYSYP